MIRKRPAIRILLAVMIPLMAFVTLASWALSSPPGSSPDDNFHLASIWCGLGERPGVCEPGSQPDERRVPATIPTATCYAFHADESGACWNPDQAGMSTVNYLNTKGLYPPVFYAAMSIFASPNVEASVATIRLMNSALVVGMLTAVFFALPRRLRPALMISAVASAVPLGVFVYASTNPSSWATLSAATVWICVYGVLRTRGRQQLTLAGLAVIGTLIGAGARADAAAFAVFGALLAVIVGADLRRRRLVPSVLLAAVAVIAVGLYLSASQGSSVATGMRDTTATPPLSLPQLISNIQEIPTLWSGAFGGWPLGWMDTPLPGAVPVLAAAVFFGALFVGLSRCSVRRGVAVALALAAMWGVPFILLAQSRAMVGELVQPRYILPLMVIALGIASARPDAARAWWGMRFILAAAALVFASSAALRTNIARYTSGLDEPSLTKHIEWWWQFGPSPLTVWVAGTAALALFFVLLWFTLDRPDSATMSRSAAPVDCEVVDTDLGHPDRVSEPAAPPLPQ